MDLYAYFIPAYLIPKINFSGNRQTTEKVKSRLRSSILSMFFRVDSYFDYITVITQFGALCKCLMQNGRSMSVYDHFGNSVQNLKFFVF